MFSWFRKLVGRDPRLIDADRKLMEINIRVDALVERVAINGGERWMLKMDRENSRSQVFECHEVEQDES